MKSKVKIKETQRKARHVRIRKKITGTALRPRLCIHRSLKNLHAQVIDDTAGKVLLGVSTLNKDLRGKLKSGGNLTAAALLGETIATMGTNKGIKQVTFDRGGFRYHGRIKAFAEAARKGGFEF